MKNHLIHKIIFQLQASGYDEARQHQLQARQFAAHQLPLLLNRYLDSLSNEDEIMYLDKLEIRLPALPWKLTDKEWQQEFSNCILTPAIGTLTQTIVDDWLYYLEQGVIKRSAIFTSSTEASDYLVKHFDETKRLLLNLNNKPSPSPFLLNRLLKSGSKQLAVEFLSFLLDIQYEEAERIYFLYSTMPEISTSIIHELVITLFRLNQQNSIKEKNIILILLKSGKIKSAINEKDLTPGLIKDLQSQTGSRIKNDSAIHCPNAGLVLLFPFLQSFFENTGLLDNNNFTDEELRKLAAQSLHFMATGNSTGPEEELLLPKLLTGMGAENYLCFEVDLPEFIKKEAEDLLTSVIEHWQKLKNTSIEGLRQSFLQRPGKLFLNDLHWILKPEESGLDILLGDLPWGFRNYKLPWMEKNLITEWY